MIGAGGLVVSIVVFGVGAVLDWAVTEPYQHGFNINKMGWILMIVGVVGATLSIIVMVGDQRPSAEHGPTCWTGECRSLRRFDVLTNR